MQHKKQTRIFERRNYNYGMGYIYIYLFSKIQPITQYTYVGGISSGKYFMLIFAFNIE